MGVMTLRFKNNALVSPVGSLGIVLKVSSVDLSAYVNEVWSFSKERKSMTVVFLHKRKGLYLVLCHSTNNEWTHHPRQGPHAVRNAHKDAGITWSNIQVIDVKA